MRACCAGELLDDVDSCDTVVYYVLLRAVDRFYSQMNRYPGLYDEHVELDIPTVKVPRVASLALMPSVGSSRLIGRVHLDMDRGTKPAVN